MRMFSRQFIRHRAALLLIPVLLTASCRKEEDHPLSAETLSRTRVSIQIDDMGSPVETRTILTDANIETRLTTLTLAVYETSGKLLETKHFTSGFNSMVFLLPPGGTYSLYALANMGDMRAAFPETIESTASLADICYSIPGYLTTGTGINDRGIPMAGSLSYSATGEEGDAPAVISLKRLLAKLNVHLSCTWPGTFQTVTLHQLNKTLRPFGESRASSASDILADVEIDTKSAAGTDGEFLFYVPENCQGTLGAITSPEDKSADNPGIPGTDLRSYLEVTVTGDSERSCEGALTYRSYLGENATSDFDILRNHRYRWDITYLPDGMLHDDWKHENNLSWTRHLYRYDALEVILYYNDNRFLSVLPMQYAYEKGVLQGTPSLDNNYSSHFNILSWNCVSGDESTREEEQANTQSSFFRRFYSWNHNNRWQTVLYAGNQYGERTVYADITDDFYDGVQEKAAYCYVTVLPYNREITVIPQGEYETMQANYGENTEGFMSYLHSKFNHYSIISDLRGYVQEPVRYELLHRIKYADGSYSDVFRGVVGENRVVEFSGYPDYLSTSDSDYSEYGPFSQTEGPAIGYITYTKSGDYKINTSCEFDELGNGTRKTQHSTFTVTIYDSVSSSLNYTVNPSNATAWASTASAGLSPKSIGVKAYYTESVNGGDPVTTDITAEASFEVTSRPAGATVSISGTTTREISCDKGGNVGIRIGYSGKTQSISLKFKDEVSSAFALEADGPATVNTGESVGIRALSTKVVNSVPTTTNVSAQATWTVVGSPSGVSVTPVGSGESAVGQITASKAGTYTVRCSYTHADQTVDVGTLEVSFIDPSISFTESPSSSHLAGDTVTLTATLRRISNGSSAQKTLDGANSTWSLAQAYSSSSVSLTNNRITAQKAGTYTVRVSHTENGHTFTGLHDVIFGSPDYSMALSPQPATVFEGKKLLLTASVTKNGSSVTPASGDITWASSSPSIATVSNSGQVTGVHEGTATVTANYKGGLASATVTVNVQPSALTVTPNPVSVIVGKTTQTLTAMLVENGETPQALGSAPVSWISSQPNIAQVSASGVVTPVAAGDVTITASAKPEGYETARTGSATVHVLENWITLSIDKDSFQVGQTAQAGVQWSSRSASGTSTGDVTGACSYSIYSSESGNTPSDAVSVHAAGVLTAQSAGTCYVEASYTKDGITYMSERVRVVITSPALSPLSLSWSEALIPALVAQRGLLKVSGLTDATATVSYTLTSGADAVRLSPSGKDSYVGLLKPGSYTIKATASNGQTGSLSGTVTAPALSLNATTFFANPDGSPVRTGTDGLSGNGISVSYRTGSTELMPVSEEVAVGNRLNQALYDELLAPVCSTASGVLHADTDGIWAKTLAGYPETDAATIGTVQIGPKSASTGIAGVALTVKSVHPFTEWTEVTALPDEEDYSLISQYVTHNYSAHSYNYPAIRASQACSGIEILLNGNVAGTAFSSAFQINGSIRQVSYTLSNHALSGHTGGVAELCGYVMNSHSLERWYRTGARFGIYVNGAIGAVMTGIGTSQVDIGTQFAGAEASCGFGSMSGYAFLTTDYTNGQPFGYIANTTVQHIAAVGSSLGERVYSLVREGGTLDSANQIMEAEKPRFVFRNIPGAGVFVNDGVDSGYYYLRPAGTPTVTDSHGEHGYYRLHLLSNIQNRITPGPKAGWILNE